MAPKQEKGRPKGRGKTPSKSEAAEEAPAGKPWPLLLGFVLVLGLLMLWAMTSH
jgi:hypothetical protein